MVELLAPAGNMACFEAALSAGADAVYVGGDRFGARAYAQNFTRDELLQILKSAHILDKKVYLTINTLMKEKELAELVPFLLPYYEEGLDGVIVQDFGALMLIREAFPLLPVHASTQMTVTGEHGAGLLKKFGVSRVVPARELSLGEIVRIKETTGLEMETFIHGAMCYSYSGQCLFSSMLGPRSGNRGRCAGPCRLPYRTCYGGNVLNSQNEMYPLSLKDLCVLEILPELINARIDSFKIEGRMKTPEYVSFVTGMYRKYIDFYMEHPDHYHVSGEDILQLQNNFSRGSIQSGYYFMHNGRELVTLNKPGYQSFEAPDRDKNITNTVEKIGMPKVELIGHFTAHNHKPLEFTAQILDKPIQVTVTGNQPQKALNRAATETDVEKQLKKTGNTPFVFSRITYEIDGDLFLPNKELNELRREALDEVEQLLLQSFQRVADSKIKEDKATPMGVTDGKVTDVYRFADTSCANGCKPLFYVGVSNISQLLALKENSVSQNLTAVFLSFDGLEELQDLSDGHKKEVLNEIQALKAGSIAIYLRMPPVVRQGTINLFENYRNIINAMNPDGFCVANLESIAYIRTNYKGKRCITDSGFYLFNAKACDFCERLDTYEHLLSYELHKKEIESLLENPGSKNHSFILPVYGYIPLMESAGCVLKTNGQCRKKHRSSSGDEVYLLDRYNKKCRVVTHCSRCENTIYNSVPLSLHKETMDIKRLPLKGVMLNFTTEDVRDMKAILDYYMAAYRDTPIQGQAEPPLCDFTKGHFLKGVE